MIADQPTMLPEQGQEMREYTPLPLPPAPAPWPQTPEPHPRPRTPDIHTLTGLEFLGPVTPEKPRPVAPTVREAEAAGNTSDVDAEQQQLAESVVSDCLPDVPLPSVPVPDVPLPDVPLPNVLLPEEHPHGLVRE